MLPQTGRAGGRTKQTDLGGWAWLIIVAYVAAYDGVALKSGKHSTLSAAFYTFSRSKVGRPSLIMFWFYLTAHLFRWIPKRYDLFRRWFG